MRIRPIAALVLMLTAGCAAERTTPYAVAPKPAEPATGSALQADAAVQRANADIADDFIELVFGLENGARKPVLTRFERPVRVGFAVPGFEDQRPFLTAFLDRIARRTGIDIEPAGPAGAGANLHVRLAAASAMEALLPTAFCVVTPGNLTWTEVARSIDDDSYIGWNEIEVIENATIFIPSSASPHEVRLCLVEEITQALGPGNDLYRLADTIFNDDNAHAEPTAFDFLILRTLYDDRLTSGMTAVEARVIAREIVDDLNPAGRDLPRSPPPPDDRKWSDLIFLAHARNTEDSLRDDYLRGAVREAMAFPVSDPRRGYSHEIVGVRQNSLRNHAEAARSLRTAIANYEAGLGGRDIRVASARLHLADALIEMGEPASALNELALAEPIITAHDADARLAYLFSLRTTALEATGDVDGSLDAAVLSLNWGLYAFGADYGKLAEALHFLDLVRSARPGST